MSVSQFVGYSVETGAFGDLKPGNDLVLPPAPLLPNKNTLSLDVPTNRPSKYTLFFLKSGLLSNETTVLDSGERPKKRLPKIVRIILKIQSGKTWTVFHLLKSLKATFTWMMGKPYHNLIGDLRRDLIKRWQKIMLNLSFTSWNLHTNGQKFNLHEGWDEWFHYHSTHQQQETP